MSDFTRVSSQQLVLDSGEVSSASGKSSSRLSFSSQLSAEDDFDSNNSDFENDIVADFNRSFPVFFRYFFINLSV